MVEVVIQVSSVLRATCLALVQLGSCDVQHCFVSKCINKTKLRHSSVSMDRGEQDEHNGEEFVSDN